MRAADFSAAESKNVSRKPTNHHTPPYMHKGSLNDCFNYYCARSIQQQCAVRSLSFHLHNPHRSFAPMKAQGHFLIITPRICQSAKTSSILATAQILNLSRHFSLTRRRRSLKMQIVSYCNNVVIYFFGRFFNFIAFQRFF